MTNDQVPSSYAGVGATRLVRAVALTCSLGLTGGCSLSLKSVDPNRPRNAAPDCDTSKTPVAADGVIGAVAGLTSLASFSDNAPEVGVLAGLTSVAFILAAARGNSSVNDCRAAVASAEYASDPEVARDERGRLRPLASGRLEDMPRTPTAPPRPDPITTLTPQPVPATKPRDVDPFEEPPEVPKPAVVTPKPPAKPVPPEPTSDEWTDFWRESQ